VEKGVDAPVVLEWGDVGKGFEEADVVVEGKFETKPQLHAPLEPHVCVAAWQKDELILWNANQCPYEVRDGLAYVFEMPESRIRIISPAIGGAFGSKNLERYIPIVALLSKRAGGKTTKIVLTREECNCHVKRAWDKSYVKIGARTDGTITAILYRSYKDLGGYGNPVGAQCGFWSEAPAISYKTLNARFEGWDVHTNLFSTQPCRSVHLPADCFAIEQVIDEVAEKIMMDPAEFRIKNMPASGDMMPPVPYVATIYDRAKLDAYPAKQLMKEVTEKIGWKGSREPMAKAGSKRRGIGIAYALGFPGFCYDGYMSMSVVVNKDGSVGIISGAQDIGTGLNTSLRMLTAEYMGINLDDVSIDTGDTRTGQYDFFGARASRSLAVGGHLLLVALEEAKQRIRMVAAPKLKAKTEDVEVNGKRAYVKGKEAKSIPLSDLLTSSFTCSATGPKGSAFPGIEPGVKPRNALVQAVAVEVDVETGQVKPIRIVTGNCPGRMINPAVVKGQYSGGAMQSLGLALYEDFKYDDTSSTILSCNYTDYKVPRAKDTPPIEHIVLTEVVDRPPHVGLPYGAMGTGELAAWGQPAAVANAIYNAIGVRVRKCPMTPEVVLEALGKDGTK
jgi:CO/xanthine dehydrogenase Mo-binding subunit